MTKQLYKGHYPTEAALADKLMKAINAGDVELADRLRGELARHRRECVVCSQR